LVRGPSQSQFLNLPLARFSGFGSHFLPEGERDL
jgi:hypothetical protein